MKAFYDDEPFTVVYETLLSHYYSKISGEIKFDDKIDPFLQTMLSRNGYFVDTQRFNHRTVKVLDDMMLVLVYGVTKSINEESPSKYGQVQKTYDYFNCYGMRYVFVFIDSLSNIIIDSAGTPEEDRSLLAIYGNSNAFKDIADIVAFIANIICNPQAQDTIQNKINWYLMIAIPAMIIRQTTGSFLEMDYDADMFAVPFTEAEKLSRLNPEFIVRGLFE